MFRRKDTVCLLFLYISESNTECTVSVNYGGVTTIRPTSVQLRQATTDHAIDGSIVILEAKSSEVVWELIKADAFYTENVVRRRISSLILS